MHHPRNRGYGGALRSGFAAASRDLVFYTDGDAQYDPSEMSVLWERFAEDVDLVNGYKISRSDPFHRIVIGRIYHHTVKLLFGLRVRDVDCDFRLMRRSIFDTVTLEKNSGVICLEMMKKIQDAGFRVAEVPVHHYHRAFGRASSSTSAAVADRPGRRASLVRPGDPALASPCAAATGIGGGCFAPRRSRVTDAYREWYRGRRVMITGGLGFIGSNVARALVELGADVLLVDSLIPDYGGNLHNIEGIEVAAAGQRR